MNAESPKLSIQSEPLSDALYLELAPLFKAEWQEVGYRKDVLILDIDLKSMDLLARNRRLAIFTLRELGALVGYMIFTIGPHPKYRTTIWASLAGWWVHPDFRRPMVAKRLVEFSEENLREYGVQFVAPAVRMDHPAAGKVLEALGYEKYEIAFFKAL